MSEDARTTAIFAILFIAFLYGFRPVSDEFQWLLAESEQELASYVRENPRGRHAEEAKKLYDEKSWSSAQQANSILALERYMSLHEEGVHINEARERHELLIWERAKTGNNVSSYLLYAKGYPEGKFATEARRKVVDLRNDQASFKFAMQDGSASALRLFLVNYPGHKRAGEIAQAYEDKLEEQAIGILLNARKIEIDVNGSSIDKVVLRIRKLVPQSLTVRIPPGTYFAANNAGSQNMVSTGETTVQIRDGSWQKVIIDAACANRRKKIPTYSDKFTVGLPIQGELARLARILPWTSANYVTRQAAIWIVTDDASYSQLGILGRPRVIKEREAVLAMQLCEQAGINISRKAIWRDKTYILANLHDSDLKDWLHNKK